jgi:hypothetical protein
MQEQRITFNTAKLAKEKEFDVLCEHSFSEHDSGIQDNNQNGFRNWNKEYKNSYSRPTQTLLQKWLREVYNTHLMVEPYYNEQKLLVYGFDLITERTEEETIVEKGFKTYEEALEVGLHEALKLIKNK